MRRFYAFVFAISLLAAACGGSGDDNAGATTTTDTNTTTTKTLDDKTGSSDTAATETTTSIAVNALGDGDPNTTFYGNPPGTGTVAVGDTKYEFDLNILCLSMAGAMGIAGQSSDGSPVSVNADFPPEGWESDGEDWDPPSLAIDDDEMDARWVAGGDVGSAYPEGSSVVSSFSSDGRLAVGEASFVNVYTSGDNLEIQTGQFEFNCPEE